MCVCACVRRKRGFIGNSRTPIGTLSAFSSARASFPGKSGVCWDQREATQTDEGRRESSKVARDSFILHR